MIYPKDDNGNVLRRMEAQGKDLTKPRNIDFAVVFANASSAEQFAQHFRELGYEVSVEDNTEPEEDLPWDVIVVKHMVPTYEGITVRSTDAEGSWLFSSSGLSVGKDRPLHSIRSSRL